MTASEAHLDLAVDDVAGFSAPKLGRLRKLTSVSELGGVVYTRPWVVNLILDLVGYRAGEDLAVVHAVEPSAGEGAFLVPMIRRLMSSASARGRDFADLRDSIRAYELDAPSAQRAVELAVCELECHGVSSADARSMAERWVKVGDYLLASPVAERADLVVGNPPYIRYDEIPTDSLAAYRKLYPTMVGRGDLYVGFLEAGLRQLAKGGVLGFICADRWMRSAYGSELRRMVSAAFGIEAVIEMHDADAFEDEVSAYPAVVIIRRATQSRVIVATASAGAASLPETGRMADEITALAHKRRPSVPGFRAAIVERWFNGTGPWPSLPPEQLSLLQRLETEFGPLEDELTGTKIGIGVATGADRVFITTDADVVESDRLIPLAMTADTREGVMRWSGHYLVDPWRRGGGLVDLSGYPQLRAHFEQRREDLLARNVAQRMPKDWYRTIDRVHHDLTRKPKLYFPDMKLTSHPVLDQGETYPHHNLYYLTSRIWDLEILGGLLLSRIAQLFIEAYCVKMRGGTLRFQAQYLRRIRVPDPDSLPADVRENLRQAFRSRDAEAATTAAAVAYRIPDLIGALRQ
ncbi:MAG TPA: Eco57I restriction-modification methylase domain-containing protein [Streptosporangiaceae bacterium]|nr:Eco57I restriction-modification methylase domain-containing protein [Streptosporangiaceae bacterium]